MTTTSPPLTTITAAEGQRRDAFAERLVTATAGAMDIFATYIGIKLGLYRALADGGPATPAQLADRAGCHPRYMREWLEQQAAGGVLNASQDADGTKRRYELPAGHAEALLDRDSLNYVAPIAQLFVGAVSPLPRLLDAYRSGDGIDFADYGADVREGQSEINRPPFLTLLPGEWLPAMPDVHARLQADPPARIADVGCGAAWSSIGMARGYPNVHLDALDLDAASVELARQNVRDHGLADRIDVQLRDAADPALAGQYDLVTVFEAVHDMSSPAKSLASVRRLIAPGGSAFIVDERVEEAFTPDAGEVERLMYGWSILHCLPAGMAQQPSVATGTVLRAPMLRALAKEAGFASVEELPLEHPFFRFYRLRP